MRDTRPTPETPSVVLRTTGVTLADKLKLSELPLATTPGGKAFCLKALHPSEHTIKSAKVPGGNKMSVTLACDMVETFNITNAGTVVQIITAPHIAVPASVQISGSGGNAFGNFYNAAFGGSFKLSPTIADTASVMANVLGKITEYRITSQSTTVELIAPALSDQGTITSAQFLSPPLTVSPAYISSNVMVSRRDAHVYQEPPLPSELLLASMAYTSKARDGCYMPLKLTSFKWRAINDRVRHFSVPTNIMDDPAAVDSGIAMTSSLDFPYFEARSSVSGWTDIPATPSCTSDMFGLTVVSGVAANVAVRVRVRQTIEVAVRPSSLYAPLVSPSLPPDETALKMYYEISSRMADAYPAAYNDLGKLFNVIKSIGQKVIPFVEPALDMLSKSPGPVGTVARVVQTAAPVVKGLVKTVSSGKKTPKKP